MASRALEASLTISHEHRTRHRATLMKSAYHDVDVGSASQLDVDHLVPLAEAWDSVDHLPGRSTGSAATAS